MYAKHNYHSNSGAHRGSKSNSQYYQNQSHLSGGRHTNGTSSYSNSYTGSYSTKYDADSAASKYPPRYAERYGARSRRGDADHQYAHEQSARGTQYSEYYEREGEEEITYQEEDPENYRQDKKSFNRNGGRWESEYPKKQGKPTYYNEERSVTLTKSSADRHDYSEYGREKARYSNYDDQYYQEPQQKQSRSEGRDYYSNHGEVSNSSYSRGIGYSRGKSTKYDDTRADTYHKEEYYEDRRKKHQYSSSTTEGRYHANEDTTTKGGSGGRNVSNGAAANYYYDEYDDYYGEEHVPVASKNKSSKVERDPYGAEADYYPENEQTSATKGSQQQDQYSGKHKTRGVHEEAQYKYLKKKGSQGDGASGTESESHTKSDKYGNNQKSHRTVYISDGKQQKFQEHEKKESRTSSEEWEDVDGDPSSSSVQETNSLCAEPIPAPRQQQDVKSRSTPYSEAERSGKDLEKKAPLEDTKPRSGQNTSELPQTQSASVVQPQGQLNVGQACQKGHRQQSNSIDEDSTLVMHFNVPEVDDFKEVKVRSDHKQDTVNPLQIKYSPNRIFPESDINDSILPPESTWPPQFAAQTNLASAFNSVAATSAADAQSEFANMPVIVRKPKIRPQPREDEQASGVNEITNGMSHITIRYDLQPSVFQQDQFNQMPNDGNFYQDNNRQYQNNYDGGNYSQNHNNMNGGGFMGGGFFDQSPGYQNGGGNFFDQQIDPMGGGDFMDPGQFMGEQIQRVQSHSSTPYNIHAQEFIPSYKLNKQKSMAQPQQPQYYQVYGGDNNFSTMSQGTLQTDVNSMMNPYEQQNFQQYPQDYQIQMMQNQTPIEFRQPNPYERQMEPPLHQVRQHPYHSMQGQYGQDVNDSSPYQHTQQHPQFEEPNPYAAMFEPRFPGQTYLQNIGYGQDTFAQSPTPQQMQAHDLDNPQHPQTPYEIYNMQQEQKKLPLFAQFSGEKAHHAREGALQAQLYNADNNVEFQKFVYTSQQQEMGRQEGALLGQQQHPLEKQVYEGSPSKQLL